ncbi:MAG TPA: tetratricopeptide repeat protein [Leptolyngbyaceae cyanobacterium]
MKDHQWLKFAEYSLLAGSGAGAIASVAAQNVLYASAPLTVLVALGLLNRNRLEQKLTRSQESLARQNRSLSRRYVNLSKQVTAMPSPESLTNFQRSVMDRSDRSFFRFSQALHTLREEFDQRLRSLHLPDLSQVNQDICQLQDQYAHTVTSIQELTSHIHRLSTLPRVEAAEAQISSLKTDMMKMRVNLEALGSETRTTLSYLQDSIQHVDRRLKPPSSSADSPHLREEVQELIKAITQLVPRQEFDNLTNRLQELRQSQSSLERAIQDLHSAGKLAAVPVQETTFEMEFFAASLKTEVEQLYAQFERLEQEIHPTATEPLPLLEGLPQGHLLELEGLQDKVAQLETVSNRLNNQQRQLLRQVEQIAQEGTLPMQDVLSQLSSRLSWTEERLQALNPEGNSATLATADPAQLQWIIDFPSGASQDPPKRSPSRRALEAALDWAHHRLVLVWPWSSDLELDDALVYRFRQLLARQCQLEIGWCHRGDRQEGRLVRAITLRWGTESTHLKTLKAALNQLMPLRQSYPDRFRFKVLGTDESFLVCDRTLAILGLQPLQTQSSVLPTVDLKLQTTDPEVILALAARFDNPTIAQGDTAAYFNRGTTRYDLRDQPGAIADFTEVIALEPNNGIAYNNRGVALVDLGQIEDAKEDFSQAIALNPNLFAAYCNRGWLRLEENRYQEAVADFSKAIDLDPDSPIPYLYRGSATQKLGDLVSAIEDYDRAVKQSDSLALPYFFRSAAYDKQGDRQQAIADLEKAQLHLEAQGDRQMLPTVQRTLSKLKNWRAASEASAAYPNGSH